MPSEIEGEKCFLCSGPAHEIFGSAVICSSCLNDLESSGDSDDEREEKHETGDESHGVWADADFTAPETDVYSPDRLERTQWMGRAGKTGKQPFAPWANRDHPEAASDEDARWKWGITDNYVDGETVALGEDDPRLAGRVFIQREDDPFMFVDGDDVRCPETGEVHPEFVRVLNELGLTYADISVSESGVHADYRGKLPEGVKQATFPIDDDCWGANDDLPEIEIYAGKHVCVDTGKHVPGTPLEVRECDIDALHGILKEYDQLPEERSETPNPAVEHSEFDAKTYTPNTTSSDETTDDIRDVFSALDHLDAQRVAARTIVHRWNDSASTSDGKRAFVPTWGTNANGTANVVDSEIWQDTGGGGYGGPVVMALIDCGEIRPESATPRVAGETWWKGIDHLRKLGFDIPKYESPTDDTEPVPVLPDADSLTTTTSGWDWKHAAREPQRSLSIGDARERTTDAITDAYNRHDQVLIEALPTMGKSYGSVKAAAQSDTTVTILTGRGRKEQYEQFREWCDEFGLTHYTLPSFTHDCETANGKHGVEWAETVRDWYARGATPREIHKSAEYVLGHPLPCQEHEGHTCPYAAKWEFDPSDYDVLIGHYSHAHKAKVTSGRTVVFDEFPGEAYETRLTSKLQGAVSYWLDQHDAIPYDDYTDLIENRGDQQRRADALTWLTDEIETDESHVFDDPKAHAAAPLAVLTILGADDLGNGWERADLGDAGIGTRNRETGAVYIQRPPAMEYASGVVALDGTPTLDMWELALGTRLNRRAVLAECERGDYLKNALNLNLVRTTDAVKPYNSADHVNVEQDAALLQEITEQHGDRPAVITTSTAEDEYDAAGILEDYTNGTKHYGNVLGSNEFKETRLGAVIGSNHYGDDYIKKWGAYANRTVERGGEKGEGLTYGAFGDKILSHMRDHDTLQAAMRFGRDGNGAVVYVHTNTLPAWVPFAGEGRVVTTWSDGMRSVLAATRDIDDWTTQDIVAHDAVSISRRQVLTHLDRLHEQGYLRREQDHEDARRVRWTDDGLHRVNEHGDVDLVSVELDDLTKGEVAEVARTTTYTWDFRNLAEDRVKPTPTPTGVTSDQESRTDAGSGGPPNRGV
ncbi:hypothetical protein V5735_01540 (plasmid) [Haladaptatus sp. SPP-AMP-3]|uniref:hypothetical protein n=1 Tax=Haladaptatus sp. SPP-AMP-3 TaxID=3121295 RepID=UPI003C2AE08C